MELRQLRYFVAVAEKESLTLAAKSKLHTSQPSLSRQIRDLEQEIGAQLITRTARGVELTPAGGCFFFYARGGCFLVVVCGRRPRRTLPPSPPSSSRSFFSLPRLIPHTSTF